MSIRIKNQYGVVLVVRVTRTRRPEATAPGQLVKDPGPKRPHATKAIRAR
jgi:hypothetical protein